MISANNEYEVMECVVYQCLHARIFGRFYGKRTIHLIRQRPPHEDNDGKLWFEPCETLDRMEVEEKPTFFIRVCRAILRRRGSKGGISER